MKLLVFSHACVTPINQDFFARVAEITGWKISIAAPHRWKGEYGLKSLEQWPSFKGEIIGLPVLFSGNVPLHLYSSTIVPVLRRVRPDVIYVHHEPYGAATAQIYAANLLSVKRPIGFFTWQNINKRYPSPFRQMEQWVYRRSDYAFHGSESALGVLQEKGYAGTAALLPPSLDLGRYYPRTPAQSAQKRRALGIQPNERVIGYAGRFVEEKGLKTLISALSILKDLRWRLCLIGAGVMEQEIHRSAKEHGIHERLLVLHNVPHVEIPEYLSLFDVLVLPSETRSNWKEQFGRVIIEAMACGTPVVGSDSGEIPHLLSRTGGGMIFPEANVAALAEALATLLLNKGRCDALAEAGRAYVRTHYSHNVVARGFAQVLAEVASGCYH